MIASNINLNGHHIHTAGGLPLYTCIGHGGFMELS